MAPDVTADNVCHGIIRVHTSQKNEKVCFTGLTDVKMIPAPVRAEAGHHAAWRWQAECVKAAVCV